METERGLPEANLCTSLPQNKAKISVHPECMKAIKSSHIRHIMIHYLAVAPTFRPTDEATKPEPNCTLFVPCNRVCPADIGCIPEDAPIPEGYENSKTKDNINVTLDSCMKHNEVYM